MNYLSLCRKRIHISVFCLFERDQHVMSSNSFDVMSFRLENSYHNSCLFRSITLNQISCHIMALPREWRFQRGLYVCRALACVFQSRSKTDCFPCREQKTKFSPGQGANYTETASNSQHWVCGLIQKRQSSEEIIYSGKNLSQQPKAYIFVVVDSTGGGGPLYSIFLSPSWNSFVALTWNQLTCQ